LPGLIGAVLAVAITVLITGGLHEDGLADTADGFGGGEERERKLEIMRDSRIGTYGVTALILMIGLKIACLGALLTEASSTALAAAGLIGAGAASRAGMVWLMVRLEPAREDGLSKSAGRPDSAALTHALAITAAVLVITALLVTGIMAAILAAAGAAAGTFIVERLARAHIEGQTGDVIGAGQQAAEAGFLLGLVIAVMNL